MKNRRIAIMVGAGFVPGINAVIKGVATAATQQGWRVIGIRDGFAGLLHPEIYPDGGLVELSDQVVESLDPSSGCILGQSARVDPFNVRKLDELEMIEDVDMSDELLAKLRSEEIDALIGVVGGQGMSILYKLYLKGLNTVCVPRSIDNDIAPTTASFGFNTALQFHHRDGGPGATAAQAARKIAVVEVQGTQVGWVALQAGIAAGADAILIPEIPADIRKVAARLREKVTPARPYGLVVVAEGARLLEFGKNSRKGIHPQGLAFSTRLRRQQRSRDSSFGIRRRDGGPGAATPDRRGNLSACRRAMGPGRHSDRGRSPLGMAYGAGAIQALEAGQEGVMVAFNPPNTEFLPLADAINKVRTVPPDGMFMTLAASLGINFGQ